MPLYDPARQLTPRESRELLDLVELVELSQREGALSLAVYARIRRCKAENALSVERNLRRLAARLLEVGYFVKVEGDGPGTTCDFGLSPALKREIFERTVSVQSDLETSSDAACSALEGRKLGLSLDRLVRLSGLRKEKLRVILLAHKCEPGTGGRPRIEELRDAEVVARAIARAHGPRRVTELARALGCHRNTARELLRRLDRKHRSEGNL